MEDYFDFPFEDITDPKAIKDYHNFNVLGLCSFLTAEEFLSLEELKKKLDSCNQKLNDLGIKHDKLLKGPEKVFLCKGKEERRSFSGIDDYNIWEQRNIINNSNNYRKVFYNKGNKRCSLDYAWIDRNTKIVYVCFTIDTYGHNTSTKSTLDRFIQLVQAKEFRFADREFEYRYFTQDFLNTNNYKKWYNLLNVKINKAKKELKALKNSEEYKYLKNIFNKNRKIIKDNYQKNIEGLKREVPPEESKKLSNKRSRLDTVKKDLEYNWTSTLTEEERNRLLTWVLLHLNKIKIKVVDQGVSDKVISTAYPDAKFGTKYREKANSSGWDAASGILYFDKSHSAPDDLLKRLSSIKHLRRTKDKGETVFRGNNINNLDLTLFLLDKFSPIGIKSGVDYSKTLLEERKRWISIIINND